MQPTLASLPRLIGKSLGVRPNMMKSIDWLNGLFVESVSWDDQSQQWVFRFTGHATLTVEGPWRISDAESILLGYGDHKQAFGLPKPIDGEKEARSLLESAVLSAGVVSPASDLHIDFANGRRLEVFNLSAGYEGWQLGRGNHLLVAQGGGRLIEWNQDA